MSNKKNGKLAQSNTGSKSNNFETNTNTKDLALFETMLLSKQEEKKEPTEQEIQDAVVLPNGATSIDFMMPEEDRNILEKNLNMYENVEQMQKLLSAAKKNKLISEEIKTLELVTKAGNFSDRLFELLLDEKNLDVLQQYLQRKFDEGDIGKAYKEVTLANKVMLDAREAMLNKIRAGKSGKTARIALKFTNDSGEDFQLGAELDT
jgi:hypothetical protein